MKPATYVAEYGRKKMLQRWRRRTTWMMVLHERVHDGAAIANALDYSLKRWAALSHYFSNGAALIDGDAGAECSTKTELKREHSPA